MHYFTPFFVRISNYGEEEKLKSEHHQNNNRLSDSVGSNERDEMTHCRETLKYRAAYVTVPNPRWMERRGSPQPLTTIHTLSTTTLQAKKK